MPFEIIRADITQVKVDAIVNAAKNSLLGGGGVDGAIHRAAGPELLKECITLGGCETGQAKLTKGYNLPAKYVIHTVGPIWQGGHYGEEDLLKACYRNSLQLALDHQMASIAFPLISSGIYGYPKYEAIKVATKEITNFLTHHEMMVYLVIYDQGAFMLSEKLFSEIKIYIDDHYIEGQEVYKITRDTEIAEAISYMEESDSKRKKIAPLSSRSLEDLIEELDETFSEYLLRQIDLRNMSDVETYKKANIDRKLFSKIRSDKYYQPSKNTAIALAIALKLSLDETQDMLMKAGYTLSKSNRGDLIVSYFIENNQFDIFEINEALFAFGQKVL